MIPVKYIGPDSHWAGLLYNTRLRFERGQTLPLPEALALKFLTHKDTFARGDGDVAPPTPEEEHARALAESQRLEQEQAAQRSEVYELFDQIERMDKVALEEFCRKYGQEIDRRRSVDKLRSEAKSFVDRFGAL